MAMDWFSGVGSRTLTALVVVVAALVLATADAQAQTIRVSQESAPGLADFDANVLGTIQPFTTTGTAADFYDYGGVSGNADSYGNANGASILSVDTSHLFLVSASDGLSLFIVHDIGFQQNKIRDLDLSHIMHHA